MNREIKFRVWDELHESFVPFKPYFSYIAQGGENGQTFGQMHVGEGRILMQYTGLKDKNGVEIFEGDIAKEVRQHHCDHNMKLHSRTGIVEWNELEAGFWVEDARLVNCSFLGCDPLSTGYEIIGNIYENPDLIPSK